MSRGRSARATYEGRRVARQASSSWDASRGTREGESVDEYAARFCKDSQGWRKCIAPCSKIRTVKDGALAQEGDMVCRTCKLNRSLCYRVERG